MITRATDEAASNSLARPDPIFNIDLRKQTPALFVRAPMSRSLRFRKVESDSLNLVAGSFPGAC
jgi:hypothetical protein